MNPCIVDTANATYKWKGKCIMTQKIPVNPLPAPLTPQNRLDTIRKPNNGSPNVEFFGIQN